MNTVMMFITRLLNRTIGEDNKKTEMCVSLTYTLTLNTDETLNRFMTANRTVRTGLTASAVVSVSPFSTYTK
jgi:hypothetical protein